MKKDKKRIIISVLAAAAILAVAATALASPNSIFTADPAPAAEIPEAMVSVSDALSATEVTYEIDTEKGTIVRDGEVVGTVDMSDGDAITVSMDGEEQTQITVHSTDADGLAFSIAGGEETADSAYATYAWTDDAE